MYQLFPQQKKRMLFYVAIILALGIALVFLNPAVNLPLLILACAFACGMMVLLYYLRAAAQHNALLARLYNQLDAEGFLRDYEPFLKIDLRSQNLYLMVRLHLSNAYCALGRFDDAIALLEGIAYRPDKPERLLLGKYSIVSNLCYCYEQKGDAEASGRYLKILREYKAQLEAMQEKKPERLRMAFSIALNEQCYRFLTEGTADIDVLRTQVQENNTQQLHRVTTSLWIARAQLAAHNRREAEALLEKIVTLAPHLYPGQLAQQILGALPGRGAEKADLPAPENAGA